MKDRPLRSTFDLVLRNVHNLMMEMLAPKLVYITYTVTHRHCQRGVNWQGEVPNLMGMSRGYSERIRSRAQSVHRRVG